MVNALKQLDICINEAKSYPGLTVVPVYSEKQSDFHVPMLFGEALKNGSLKIQEQQQSNVPRLSVDYVGEGYALGIKGHLLIGGGQDRQLYHSCLVSKGRYDIPVQCVQHGRWNPGKNKDFTVCNDITSSGLRFNTQNQGQTWEKIRTYETLTNTNSGSESFTCTRTITMGSSVEQNSLLQQNNVKMNDKMLGVRERAQEMLSHLKTPKEQQIGFFAIQIDPFTWVKNKEVHLNYLLEIAGNAELWNSLHQKAIESVIYDSAVCEMDKNAHIEMNDERKAEIAEFVAMLTVEDWNECDFIGQESRFALESKKYFGEAIYLDEEDEMPIHLLCSSLKVS
ncbi:ARPP-1 family domain-containing protein [Candidatus Uabimicrobium sp. HlEnr_7]|uniref:ARPP-1 family domain-containing protein n=1 Tax=Candidatus Uabimicrobium helgolandensis TaxID=3095367 RepID=UPI0035574BF6